MSFRDVVVTLPAFAFEGGGVQDLEIGFRLHGDPARELPLVLLQPGTSGDRSWADALVGPEAAFDPSECTVLVSDSLGAGLSTGARAPFLPSFTIRDMAIALAQAIKQIVGCRELAVIGGPSMGAFLALEWAALDLHRARSLLLMVPAAQADAHFRDIVGPVVAILEDRRKAESDRLVEAEEKAWPSFIGSEDLSRTASARERFTTRWRTGWRPEALALRYRASAGHDLARGSGQELNAVLRRIRQPALIVGCAQDRLVLPEHARGLAAQMPAAELLMLDSPLGHLASSAGPGHAEHQIVRAAIRSYWSRHNRALSAQPQATA